MCYSAPKLLYWVHCDCGWTYDYHKAELTNIKYCIYPYKCPGGNAFSKEKKKGGGGGGGWATITG